MIWSFFQGRCPHYLEPAVIIVLTDGGKLTGTSGVQQEVKHEKLTMSFAEAKILVDSILTLSTMGKNFSR